MSEPAVRPADPKLRRAAIHESSHAWVAIAYGDPAPQVRVYAEGDSYGGQCKPSIPYPSPTANRHVALAGICGVCIDFGLVADQVFDMLLSGELKLSPADVPLVGTYTRQDIVAVFDLLRTRWNAVEAVADRLADTAR